MSMVVEPGDVTNQISRRCSNLKLKTFKNNNDLLSGTFNRQNNNALFDIQQMSYKFKLNFCLKMSNLFLSFVCEKTL